MDWKDTLALAHRLHEEYDDEGALYAVRDRDETERADLKDLVWLGWKNGMAHSEVAWILQLLEEAQDGQA